MKAGRSVYGLLLALMPACEPADVPFDQCDVGVDVAEVQSADRKILGAAADYPADGMLRAREDALLHSQKARREVAWETVARVLAPAELAEALPSLPGQPAQVPSWHTWYARDDINRLFNHLYDGLGVTGRAERERFTELDLDQAFAWNPRAVEELPNWPQERWDAYLEAIDETAEVAGIGGIAAVGYSPSAARHLLASYPDILQCREGGVPAQFVDGPAEETRRMVREQVRLAGCEQRLYGPFFVAGGETIRATLDASPGIGAESAELSIRAGAVPAAGEEVCRADGTGPCEAAGPGAFHVAVRAGAGGVDAALDIEYDQPDPEWSACLDGPFPLDAAVMKASWHRAQFGQMLPIYDTSARALSERMAPDGDADWGTGAGDADPGPEDIYTVKLPNGNIYRLAALHIMTKELDHWLWITLWWSPDPDSDFGADRPAGIADIPGPWENYKMCVATAFEERDPDPGGGFADSAPTLGAALAAVYRGQGAPTWCSNPYLERGPGNAATNCIGCHQHGGVDLLSEQIIADEAAFPAHGSTQIRNNFPTDYSWAVDAGDRLGRLFAEVVAYYDAND